MQPLNPPPPNALIATTEHEHRFHRLCAEWDRFPHARKAIKSQIQSHPEWGIEIRPNDVLAFNPQQSTITVQAQIITEVPQKSNLSYLKQLASGNPYSGKQEPVTGQNLGGSANA